MPNIQDIKELVSTAHHMLFTLRDDSALELYFSPDFIEHSPLVTDGLPGLKQLIQDCPQLQHETIRILADGDLVAIHGRFEGLDTVPLVGFDIYRVHDGKIVEHWDGLVPEAAPNSSGRTQLDGPTQVISTGQEQQNRQLVTQFVQKCMIDGDYEAFRTYSDGIHFLQHLPDIGDGITTVIDFLNKRRQEGQGLLYSKTHRTLADGQFVLTHSEGSIAGARHAHFELWRVEDGQIGELWSVISAVPADDQALHSYGMF